MLLGWLTAQDNGNVAKSYKNQLLGVKNGYKLRKTIHKALNLMNFLFVAKIHHVGNCYEKAKWELCF
jgi:hypothetical protein